MAKLVEMVRNSPLVGRKIGGYEVLDTENQDPFVQGVAFNAHFVASVDVETRQDSPEVQRTVSEACTIAQKNNTKLRKVVLTVKSNTVLVKDVGSKSTDDYPIFLIAYCGGHGEIEELFFFIHKSKIDKQLKAEIFKCSDVFKVKALTLTVAKAFNIAYKAWTAEKRRKEKANRGSNSPLSGRREGDTIPLKKNSLAKMAPGIASETHTPPALRKPSGLTEATQQRRGSFGDKPVPSATKNPAVVRVMTQNESTGSKHNVNLTDDFDQEFQELAESRVRPEVLRTSLIVEETDHFSFDKIREHIDSIGEEEPVQEPVE